MSRLLAFSEKRFIFAIEIQTDRLSGNNSINQQKTKEETK